MQILLVVIEKDGANYIGRSPNLLGEPVIAATRDEAESAVINQINERISELRDRHNNRPTISLLPVEEIIDCVYEYEDRSRIGYGCAQQSRKDGLCWQHWKKLYSHAFGTRINLKACPLCGESDREILKQWDSPCSFKIENPNWSEVLESRKKEMKRTAGEN